MAVIEPTAIGQKQIPIIGGDHGHLAPMLLELAAGVDIEGEIPLWIERLERAPGKRCDLRQAGKVIHRIVEAGAQVNWIPDLECSHVCGYPAN